MEYDNSNRGVLFKNDRKEKDTDPDYKGSYMNGDGVDNWLNAWIAKDKNGRTYMKLSTMPKDDAHKQGMQQARQAMQPKVEFDDDLPF